MTEILTFIRGLQRPFVVVFVVLVALGIVAFLVGKFGNVTMAEQALDAILIAFALIAGYLFGERKATKPS